MVTLQVWKKKTRNCESKVKSFDQDNTLEEIYVTV